MTHTLRQTYKLVDLQCQNPRQLCLLQSNTPEHSPWLVIVVLLRESDEVGKEIHLQVLLLEDLSSILHWFLVDVSVVIYEGRMFIP
jgi:hypothetical protein